MPIQVSAALDQFAEVIAGQGLAPAHVKRVMGYLRGGNGFLAACRRSKGQNVTMGQLDDGCISAYFAAQTDGTGSRNNKLAAVRKFIRWAERKRMLRPGLSADDILDGQKTRKYQRQPKIYVEAAGFGGMLDAAEQRHPRDRAAVALILYTLARQSEIKLLKLSDLDLDRLTVQIYRQKTKRYTETGVTPELAEEMGRWLNWYAADTGYATWQDMAAEHPQWHLVPCGMRGQHWRRVNPASPVSGVEDIVKAALAGIGYSALKGEGGHTIRRSGARAMFLYLRDGIGFDGALVRVQNMLDHESPQMTLKYIGMNEERHSLNEWLKSNSMYGTPVPQAPKSNVVQFPRRHSA